MTKFGHLAAWSMGLTVATWAFAISSFASLFAAVHAWKRRKEMNRFAYYHSLAVAVVFVIAALYLARFGVIGYRSWA